MDRTRSVSLLAIIALTTISIRINSVHAANDNGLEGKLLECQNEGETVPVENLLTTSTTARTRCYSCVCKNGFVECSDGCPRIDDCHIVVDDGGCCKRCKGCNHAGEFRPSHTEWTDSLDPCTVYRCESGVVTQSNLHCHTPCADPKPPEPGKCCATCSECKINGQIAHENQDVISDDPCLQCRCHNGSMQCSKKACPVLPCTKQYLLPGECCPRCNGTSPMYYTRPNACLVQKTVIYEDEFQELDHCTRCTCMNSTTICSRNACPILDCAPELQKSVRGSCCKKCVQPEEVRTQCMYDSRSFQDGESLQLDACKSCTCTKGMLSCAMTKCNVTLPCAPGTRKIMVPGECCPKCEEVDGVCMVFGDPHYKTFDGKIYSFKGIGKYQLVADCRNNSFSIRVANSALDRFISSSTKRVGVKYGQIRFNLQQRGKVRFNGDRIEPPFTSRDNKVVIERIEQDYLRVTLDNGVKLLWNGNSFLEVSVPAKFKNNLCGLCGNFNSHVQDDLKTKHGVVVGDSETVQFASSWCVGRRSECDKKVRAVSQKACMKRQPRNRCQAFVKKNNHVFGNCNSKLNNMKYYDACKMDMCSCASKKCYCESMIAYARECERLGGKLMAEWQKELKCDANNVSGKRRKDVYRRTMVRSTTPDPLLRMSMNLRESMMHYNRGSKSPIPLV